MRYLLSLVFFFLGSIHVGEMESISLRLRDYVSNEDVEYSFCLPRGYKHMVVINPDMYFGETFSHQYRYKNGACFFIGNGIGGSIHNIGSYSMHLVANDLLLDPETAKTDWGLPDHWDLTGNRGRNKYWRNYESLSLAVGYYNVPKRYLATFDSFVDSIIQKYAIAPAPPKVGE